MASWKSFAIMWWLIWFVPLVNSAILDNDQHPQVSIKQGVLRGKTMITNTGQEFEAFLGIPYGKRPEPAEPWKGILDATQDGLSCKQFKLLGKNYLRGLPYSKPNFTDNSDNLLLPVLVYIYGGGFVGGVSDSKSYGPGRLMDGVPIVLILFNYRTGSFGFLSTNDEVSPGNFGLLDQLMALQWIQDNVKSFGGDPNKVTISGESAGAASVMLHIVSPLSKDLFHGAIVQSGHTLPPWPVPRNAENTSRNIAQTLGCPTETTLSIVECLRKVDADDLSKIPGRALSTGPVIDGHFLTESPIKSLREGRFHKVPVISGVTADETALMLARLISQDDSVLKTLSQENWGPLFSSLVQDNFDYLNNDTVKNAIKKMYFPTSNANGTFDITVGNIELASDILFNSGNDKTVRLLAYSGSPVYMYVFDHSSWDISSSNLTGRPDVGHTSELSLLFNRNTSSETKYSEETEQVSKNMVKLWTNFAAYGNPTPSGPLIWTNVLPEKNLPYLNISANLKMEEGYLTERMTFWEDLLYNET